jgi:ABC-type branched-subunit amino acid transport system substrate-binding protein
MSWRQVRGLRRRLPAALSVVLTAAAFAACGSDDDDNATAAGGGATSGAAASAPELKIGIATTVVPGSYDAKTMFEVGVKAAEGYIEENGGWGGRKVSLSWCVSPGDPASDTKCYRQFVSDEVDVAMGVLANHATVGLPMLSDAGIPSFMTPTSPKDDESEWQHSLTGGAATAEGAIARYLCAQGAKKVSVIIDDAPFAKAGLAKYAESTYEACGIALTTVASPYGTPDPAPYIQKAIAGTPDALVVASVSPATATLKAVTGAKFPISKTIMVANAGKDFYTDPMAEGVSIVSSTRIPLDTTKNQDAQTYLQMVEKYAKGGDPLLQFAAPAYQQLTTIWQAAKAIGFDKADGASIQEYMANEAAGKLRVLMALPIEKVPELPGVHTTTGMVSKITAPGTIEELGWYEQGTCNSAEECKEGVLPADS